MVNPKDLRSERIISGRLTSRSYLNNRRQRSINDLGKRNQSIFSSSSSSIPPLDSTTIRVVRGTTDQRGKIIPTIHLHSPTTNRRRRKDEREQDSFVVPSIEDRSSQMKTKRSSIVPRGSCSLDDFSCPSDPFTETTNLPLERETSFSRRDSLATTMTGDSLKSVVLNRRAPSTPVDPRCERAFSSLTKSMNRETCDLLGPELCSDCLELKMRRNLSAEHLPSEFIRRRLSALAIQTFLPKKQSLNEQELLKLFHDQRIELLRSQSSSQFQEILLSDQEYFSRLSQSLIDHSRSHSTPFFFHDLKDLQRKYSSNIYPRLHLDETPIPHSANPIFNRSQIECFDVSSKYSQMKCASKQRYPFHTKATIFVSPRKSERFIAEHRYLNNSSPPLLQQTIQQTIKKKNSNPNLLLLPFNPSSSSSSSSSSNPRRKSLIGSKLPLQ